MQIFVGYITFSFAIGILLGASNSPVIGAFLAIIVGLLGTLFGAIKLYTGLNEKERLNKVGGLLTAFSIFLISGTYMGELYRVSAIGSTTTSVPWSKDNRPLSTAEALDWLVLKEKLQSLGYSEEVLLQIYSIRIEEIKVLKEKQLAEVESDADPYNKTVIYDPMSPFNSIIPVKTMGGRGLASIEEN
ncbi:hypothetical protein C3B51_19605 [Pseudoalteromonas rubra]|uniref:Uncharacterized protein n=1 Tax=Pseudoalteromonas rubra TaxID=43658 RepID=A0A4Q7E147_9GAMM|nr:hypothetical protein [Pseudoalteromonas rubra]RZM74809.1 hypothetical protein C3B51_19605 [Pseudoalteromonas rubra]